MARKIHKKTRLYLILAFLTLGGASLGLILYGLGDGLYFYLGPSEAINKHSDKKFRLGGLVAQNSVRHENNKIYFAITDNENQIMVEFNGILPDLFREGQGVVALGQLQNGVFIASEVLAKHDEKYMPPEAIDAMKKAGQWKGEP